jgi:hypothetical protein
MSAVIIVTRFGVHWKKRLPSKEWIDYRFEILKRTALPSLKQQTIQNFVWVVKTAPEYYNYVTGLFKPVTLPNGVIKIVSQWPGNGVRLEGLQDIYPGVERFITFRFDSDDAFSPRAIERVLMASANITENTGDQILFNLPSGIQLDWKTGEMFYLTFRSHRQGPYLAFTNASRERMLFTGEGQGSHVIARRFANKVVHVSGLNWIQAVHGKNISSAIRYKKVRYKKPIVQLVSTAAILWPRLKIADTSCVPTHLQESILAEFGVCWEGAR